MFFYRKKSIRSFSLMEIVIAIGVVVVAIIPLMGLLPVGFKTVQTSSEQTHAQNLLTALIQDMRYTPRGSNQTVIFSLPNPPGSGAGVNQIHRAWIDLDGKSYASARPEGFCYEVTWVYTKIPEKSSLAPIECSLTIKWPVPLKSEVPPGACEISTVAVFDPP